MADLPALRRPQVGVALLAAALLLAVAWRLPFDLALPLADRISEDGDASLYNAGLHDAIRSLAGLLAAFFAATGLALIAASFGSRSAAGRSRWPHGSLYLGITSFLLVLYGWHLYYLPWATNYDVWEHAAVIRALARTEWAHPFLATADPHHFSSPYLVGLGLVLRALPDAVSVFDLLVVSGLLNHIFLFAGLYFFLGLLFPRRGRVLCLLLLLLLVGAAGIKGDLGWLTAHGLSIRLPYPSRFVIGLLFWTLYAAARMIRERRPWIVAPMAVAVAVAVLTHPISAVTLLTGLNAGVVVCWLRGDRRGAGWLALPQLLAVPLVFAWPYYSFWSLVVSDSGEITAANWQIVYGMGWLGMLKRDWPQLLLGVPALGYVARSAWRHRRPRHAWLALTTLGLLLTFALGAHPRFGVLGRTLGGLLLMLDICLAVALTDWTMRARWPRSKRHAVLATLVALALWLPYLWVANGPAVRKHWLKGVRYGVRLHLEEELGAVARRATPGSVVLADPSTSYQLPAFAEVKVLATTNQSTFVSGMPARRDFVRRFFDLALEPAERRRLLAKYQVRYVMLDTSRPEWKLPLADLEATEIGDGNRRFRLFELAQPDL